MAVDPQQYAQLQAAGGNGGWYNACQRFVRTALGFSGGVPGGGSARDEYNYTKAKGNISQGTPPPNVPVYFDTKGAAGHVALSAGNGYAWTTDMDGPGTVSLQKISDIAAWAGPTLGWGSSEGDKQLTETGGGDGSTFLGKLANGAGLFLDPIGAIPGHTSVGSIPGLGFLSVSKDAGAVGGAVGGAAGGILGDIGSGIASGLKAVFTGEFMKRLMAAVVGGLLILMALYKLSGMTAVPIPV